jgi:tether containing UBX domain for GLUT4
MSSQVTVIGPSARRHVVKTTPSTSLNDVLEQACTKMRLDPAQYGLKHNNKAVDLSRTMRLSGLTSGAKLELTMLSRSPSVVSVALQLPSGTRLLDKFPSNTTLWLILRKFESGVAGGGTKENLTVRGIPKTNGQGGSGRLYHEEPVLQIMGRDYGSFTDLQKSLGQIGFKDGNVLLKLSFRQSETPLEEAIQHMNEYFESAELDANPSEKTEASGPAKSVSSPQPSQTEAPGAESELPDKVEAADQMDKDTTGSASTTIANRPTSIYRPPTSSTPQAAQTPHNPADYVPTVEHAKVHQASLAKAGQNQRLLTDTELTAQAAERTARRASITSVTIKVRFPDESSAIAPFTQTDTAEDLYRYVEGLLRSGVTEPFEVAFAGPKGKMILLARNNQKLIGQVGLEGKVLVQVRWAEGASSDAKKGPSLRKEVAGLGREMEVAKVPEINDAEEEKATPGKANLAPAKTDAKEKGKGIPKWFKMGKK